MCGDVTIFYCERPNIAHTQSGDTLKSKKVKSFPTLTRTLSCKYTHNGVEYTSDVPIVVDMDEQSESTSFCIAALYNYASDFKS